MPSHEGDKGHEEGSGKPERLCGMTEEGLAGCEGLGGLPFVCGGTEGLGEGWEEPGEPSFVSQF